MPPFGPISRKELIRALSLQEVKKMAKTKHWTLADHRRVGKSVKAIHDELLQLYINVSNAYGKTHQTAKKMLNTLKALDAFRNEIDNVLAKETDEEEWHAKRLFAVYYGIERE